MDADSYRRSTLTPEQAAEHDRVFGDLASRTRALMEAQLLTEVDHDEVAAIGEQLDALTERLKAAARTDPHGVEVGPGGRVRNFGNAVVGLRNPIAPPVKVERSPDGKAWASFRLGPLFEGPRAWCTAASPRCCSTSSAVRRPPPAAPRHDGPAGPDLPAPDPPR